MSAHPKRLAGTSIAEREVRNSRDPLDQYSICLSIFPITTT